MLIDRDGDAKRRRDMKKYVSDLSLDPPRVLGIAREEFEAWLVADAETVGNVLQVTLNRTKSPESMKPRQAKEILEQWIAKQQQNSPKRQIRKKIALNCDLGVLKQRCKWGFARFAEDLQAACEYIG